MIECDGEFEPGCDLGSNPKYVSVYEKEIDVSSLFKNGPAADIERMTPGARVIINGVEYMRLEDVDGTFFYDKIACIKSGKVYTWYSLCYANDTVTFIIGE